MIVTILIGLIAADDEKPPTAPFSGTGGFLGTQQITISESFSPTAGLSSSEGVFSRTHSYSVSKSFSPTVAFSKSIKPTKVFSPTIHIGSSRSFSPSVVFDGTQELTPEETPSIILPETPQETLKLEEALPLAKPTITPQTEDTLFIYLENIDTKELIGIIVGSIVGVFLLILGLIGWYIRSKILSVAKDINQQIEDVKTGALDGYIERKIQLEREGKEQDGKPLEEFASNSESLP
jgi:hypothetical protein